MSRQPKIVVIGGGTGSFTVLSGLKTHTPNLTAIVNMSDDGGSTGILRDELGVLPPGDIRQCLVALSRSDKVMRDLFTYRFEEGTLAGHAFGNLFLTALEKTTGSFAEAVKAASEVLNITGQVLPVTLDNIELVLRRADGTVIEGQYAIEETKIEGGKPQLALKPEAKLNPEARAAIMDADLIVIAPGNLYASLAPTLIVGGMGEALKSSPAPIVYVANLVTRPGQTDGFKVSDYAREIERFIGQEAIDYVIYNTHKPGPDLLERYAKAGEFAVEYDPATLGHAHYKTIGADLVSESFPHLTPADQVIPRTLIRHDGDKLAKLIIDIAKS